MPTPFDTCVADHDNDAQARTERVAGAVIRALLDHARIDMVAAATVAAEIKRETGEPISLDTARKAIAEVRRALAARL